MVSEDQIQKAEATARNAFEATKRIYDLAFIAHERLSADVGEQLGLKVSRGWNSQSASYINQYGRLTDAESWMLRRYGYTVFTASKARHLPPEVAPFILFSLLTRKADPPRVIYGILTNIDWGENQAMEHEPFLYEISEKREQKPLEVRGVRLMSKRGSADVDFESLSLFAVNDDTIGEVTKRIVDWLEDRLTHREGNK